MTDKKLIITPKTKVGELLDAYPELESLLMELSPAFAKLRNPILRKTVGRIASLQQAAVIGGLKVDDLVNRLRKETGQESFSDEYAENSYLSESVPEWFDVSKVTIRLDARPIINSGNSPMNEILKLAHNLNSGEILELCSPFIPAPIIDMLKNKAYRVYSTQKGNDFFTYLTIGP